ncbi:MAG: triose-phosphate isomerase [Parachlamydiaceae bacterium]
MKRRHLFAANWKMHKTVEQAERYIKQLQLCLRSDLAADIFIAPPFTALYSLAHLFANGPIVFGAQNVSDQFEGALTGEISVNMIIEGGARFVILGHSERRHIFHEDNDFIQRKIMLALQNNLEVLLCVGETAVERSAGKTFQVIAEQLKNCLKDVREPDFKRVTIAYEPIWAIGSGQAANPKDAQEIHAFIRQWCTKNEKNNQESLRVLYGGSVNSRNAANFLNEEDIDGLLVGTASLDPNTFSEIVNLG